MINLTVSSFIQHTIFAGFSLKLGSNYFLLEKKKVKDPLVILFLRIYKGQQGIVFQPYKCNVNTFMQ